MAWIVEALASLLLIAGGVFLFIGSLGMAHLKDFYMRLHGPTKATTLGIGGMLIASIIHFTARDPGLSIHEILVIGFLFLTAPVSAHLMAKASLHLEGKQGRRGADQER